VRNEILVLCVALSLAGCSDEAASGPAVGGASTGGSAAGVTGGETGNDVGGGPASGPCRTGSVTDAAPLFSKLAGSYVFARYSAKCEVAGFTLQKDQPYTVTLSDAPQAIRVEVDASSSVEFAWDGPGDVACTSETVGSIEIDGHGSFARISFVTSPVAPGTLTLGSCGFTGR
jgi:hypothetical protein